MPLRFSSLSGCDRSNCARQERKGSKKIWVSCQPELDDDDLFSLGYEERVLIYDVTLTLFF